LQKSIAITKSKINKKINKKMKNILFGMLLLAATFSAQGQDKKNKNANYTTEVNGNCGLCKKRIEKAAFSVAGVKSAVWDMDTHQLSLILNEEKTTILDVKKAVAKIGHDTDEVKATDETYANLHGCCQYERK
jgi:mercuric ion binding protein